MSFKKFAPQLDVAVYGLKPNVMTSLLKTHDYYYRAMPPSVRFDAYRAGQYDYLILDEAQVMKNTQTKIAQYLRDSVPHCLALSGTPIENHLVGDLVYFPDYSTRAFTS